MNLDSIRVSRILKPVVGRWGLFNPCLLFLFNLLALVWLVIQMVIPVILAIETSLTDLTCPWFL